jgi:diaminopimelate epimerase
VTLRFVKMSGAGNDLVVVDHRAGFLRGREEAFARAACDRRRGVGADGVILLEPDDELDFAVRFFNPDGGEYELCGNGARCLPRFAEEIGLPGTEYRFRSDAGLHRAARIDENTAWVELNPVREVRLDVEVDLDGAPARMDWGDIGVPHGAFWTKNVAEAPVAAWGAHLRRHPAFGAEGTNVSFVERIPEDRLRIRTFERGVEGETLACGSGSAVVATIARQRGFCGDRVELEVRSEDVLTVRLPDQGASHGPRLEGPVTRPFAGELDLDALLAERPPVR